jgi:hypothetical protein
MVAEINSLFTAYHRLTLAYKPYRFCIYVPQAGDKPPVSENGVNFALEKFLDGFYCVLLAVCMDV